MRAKIILENGQDKEFFISDRDVELLEKSAAYKAQMLASDGNAASEIAFGIIPWGIEQVRLQMKGMSRGDILTCQGEDEHE